MSLISYAVANRPLLAQHFISQMNGDLYEVAKGTLRRFEGNFGDYVAKIQRKIRRG